MSTTTAGRRTLVLNAGSSSLKVSLVDGDETVLEQTTIEDWDGDYTSVELPDWDHDVIGHRVVHGGSLFPEAVWLDESVRRQIEGLTPLAPLHQGRSCAGIDAAGLAYPHSPAFAAFDTTFHARLPAAARTYAVPPDWPVRRYGAHGLSHACAARRTATLLGRDVDEMRVVTCHLGSGASLCAVDGGRSIDTTMGMTPLEGVIMSTRSGTIDPGVVLWLQRHRGMHAAEVQEALQQRSGLLALAGIADMEEVFARADRGDDRASFAIDVYVHRLVKEVAGMVAALCGADALTFTGGIGEHSPRVRSLVMDALTWLGASIDQGRNGHCVGDAVLTGHGSGMEVLVVSAHEDVEVARHGHHLRMRGRMMT